MIYIRNLMLVLALGLSASTVAQADVLLVDSVQAGSDVPTPRKASNMTQVRQQYGEPASQHAAVGEPPITRWDYAGFSVFFEHDLVLHSVVHRTTKK